MYSFPYKFVFCLGGKITVLQRMIQVNEFNPWVIRSPRFRQCENIDELKAVLRNGADQAKHLLYVVWIP